MWRKKCAVILKITKLKRHAAQQKVKQKRIAVQKKKILPAAALPPQHAAAQYHPATTSMQRVV